MLIQLLLTGLAGIVLGAVLMRQLQRRTEESSEKAADAAPAAKAEAPGRLQTRAVLGGAAAIAVVAGGIALFRAVSPSDGVETVESVLKSAPAAGAAQLDDVDTMISRLEARLKQNPNDGEGFRMLGWSFLNTGKPAEAVLAYANAAKLLPQRADVHAGYGEALVAVAGDKVTAEAKSHFDLALRLDPEEPRARFFLSLHKAQSGNERAALDEWIALSNGSPSDRPWQADVRQRIERLAAKLGVNVSGRLAPAQAPTAPPGEPSSAQMAAVRALPADQQQSMIDGMVSGLAAKLQSNPDNLEGWLKLIRSRVVLKDTARARADLATARKTFSGQPEKLAQINALAGELGL